MIQQLNGRAFGKRELRKREKQKQLVSFSKRQGSQSKQSFDDCNQNYSSLSHLRVQAINSVKKGKTQFEVMHKTKKERLKDVRY